MNPNQGTKSASGHAPKVIKCKDAVGAERRLCSSLVPPAYIEDAPSQDAFEITYCEVDLNNDRREEIVAWESSWAGTSGGSLWILRREGDKYVKLLETDMAWSPILFLPSKHNGWRDLAYYVAGGGVEPVFVTIRRGSRTYRDRAKISTKRPKGEILIEKKWSQTLFGPQTER